MSLWLQLPEQRGLGIAKPFFVDRIIPAMITVFWSGKRELFRRLGPCQGGWGIWGKKPACSYPAKPEQNLHCCSGPLLAHNLLFVSLGGLGSEPMYEDPETLLSEKYSPENLFLASLISQHSTEVCLLFLWDFPLKFRGLCAVVWPWGSPTLGYSDFILPTWPLVPFQKPTMDLP